LAAKIWVTLENSWLEGVEFLVQKMTLSTLRLARRVRCGRAEVARQLAYTAAWLPDVFHEKPPTTCEK